MNSMEQQQGKSASARPITADEIVRVQEERKRKAAGTLGKGAAQQDGAPGQQAPCWKQPASGAQGP